VAEAGSVAHERSGNKGPQAKVTIAKAEAIALKARPGKVTDRELEKKGGGLRYSFDIASGGKTYEVGVDASTGKVLDIDAEGMNSDWAVSGRTASRWICRRAVCSRPASTRS
jgi:uncharacterized membrane protein YkoI